MQILIEEHDKVLVVKLSGHLGHASVDELTKVFDEKLGQNKSNFIVDLSDLQYISSAGLRCLLQASSKVDKLSGKIILCALQPEVKQIFDVSGFTSLFPVYETLPKALRHI